MSSSRFYLLSLKINNAILFDFKLQNRKIKLNKAGAKLQLL